MLDVDAALVRLAREGGATLITVDHNMAKVAEALRVPGGADQRAGIEVPRAVFSAGDEITVRLVKEGREHGQAVGYLDDGTMVVVEKAVEQIGSSADIKRDERDPDDDRPHGLRRALRRGVGATAAGIAPRPPLAPGRLWHASGMNRAARRLAVVLAAGAGRRLGADNRRRSCRSGGGPWSRWPPPPRPRRSRWAPSSWSVPPRARRTTRRRCGRSRGAGRRWYRRGDAPGVGRARARRGARGRRRSSRCTMPPGRSRAPELFTAVIDAIGDGDDGAVPVVPVADTVKRIQDGRGRRHRIARGARAGADAAGVPRRGPRRGPRRAEEAGIEVTDDAARLEWAGYASWPSPATRATSRSPPRPTSPQADARMGGGDG